MSTNSVNILESTVRSITDDLDDNIMELTKKNDEISKKVFTLIDAQINRDIVTNIRETDKFIENSINEFKINILNKKRLIYILGRRNRTINIMKYSECAPILYLYYKEKYKKTSLSIDDIKKVKISITISFKELYMERLNKELSFIKKKFNKKKQSE